MSQTREAFDAWQRFGSKAEAARQLGIPITTLKARIERYNLDPAIKNAQQAAGTNLVPQLVWAKTKDEDGTSFSMLLKPEQSVTDSLEQIREAFEGMKPAKLCKPPKDFEEDLLTLIPVSDLHSGMMAWGKETGEDYDTTIATERLIDWVSRCVSSSPKSGKGVVLFNGDTLHANDVTAQTPQSKHVLDVDTRHFRTIEMTITAIAVSVDLALARYNHVSVVIKPGNHDRDSYLALLFAIAERYRNEPRISVNKEPSEFWCQTFGTVMLAAHHGDKARAQRLVLHLADAFPDMWGATRHRYLFTGHLHHHKSEDIGGCQWEQLRAVTAKDAYASQHAYSARAELQAITYHKDRGEVSRVKVCS